MTTSILAFNEHASEAARWSTRTASTASSLDGGSTTGTLPLTNIFTKNPGQVWERINIGAAETVLVDVQLINATTVPPPLANAAAVWGLLNCYGFSQTNSEQLDLSVRLRESNTAFTGTYQCDKTHVIYGREFQNAAPRQTWFLRDGSAPMDSWTSSAFANRGGSLGQAYVRIEFSVLSSPGLWTLRVGRLARMSGLVCKITAQPRRSGWDQSEVVRSFSGYPYLLTGSRGRRYSGSVVGLTDRQVDGVYFQEDAANRFAPSINTIARLAGRSSEVCVIERAAIADSSSRWQQQPVFGYFDQDVVATRTDNTQDGGGLSTLDFEVVETPQF